MRIRAWDDFVDHRESQHVTTGDQELRMTIFLDFVGVCMFIGFILYCKLVDNNPGMAIFFAILAVLTIGVSVADTCVLERRNNRFKRR